MSSMNFLIDGELYSIMIFEKANHVIGQIDACGARQQIYAASVLFINDGEP